MRVLRVVAAIAAAAGTPLHSLPIPRTWFPVVKSLSNTRYYREVLAECGLFADWPSASRS